MKTTEISSDSIVELEGVSYLIIDKDPGKAVVGPRSIEVAKFHIGEEITSAVGADGDVFGLDHENHGLNDVVCVELVEDNVDLVDSGLRDEGFSVDSPVCDLSTGEGKAIVQRFTRTAAPVLSALGHHRLGSSKGGEEGKKDQQDHNNST